jgi:hypothetical protein
MHFIYNVTLQGITHLSNAQTRAVTFTSTITQRSYHICEQTMYLMVSFCIYSDLYQTMEAQPEERE